MNPISWVFKIKKYLDGGFESHYLREKQGTETVPAAEIPGNSIEHGPTRLRCVEWNYQDGLTAARPSRETGPDHVSREDATC